MCLEYSYAKELYQLYASNVKNTWPRFRSRLSTSSHANSFYNYLCSNTDSLAITGLCKRKKSVRRYGKLISLSALSFDEENSQFDLGIYHVAASKREFGNVIGCYTGLSFTPHFLIRFIQRYELIDFKAFMEALHLYHRKHRPNAFLEQYGYLDIGSDCVIVTPQELVFAYNDDSGNEQVRLIHKSIVTESEFFPQQREIIKFVLEQFDSDMCILATHELPNTFNEALNVIEDTKLRVSSLPTWGDKLSDELTANSYNLKKRMDNRFSHVFSSTVTC